jgi:quercetin dioxygenase-like cupin family protein
MEDMQMLATNVNDLALNELSTPADPSLGIRFAFPISAATGAAASAVVYFEVAPGKRLGRHTDSSEEVLYVIEGDGEATVGDERVALAAGSLAVVPALVPHDIRNTGSVPIKVVGFFAGSALMHAFFEPLLPGAEVMIVAHGPDGESLFAGTPFVPAMMG